MHRGKNHKITIVFAIARECFIIDGLAIDREFTTQQMHQQKALSNISGVKSWEVGGAVAQQEEVVNGYDSKEDRTRPVWQYCANLKPCPARGSYNGKRHSPGFSVRWTRFYPRAGYRTTKLDLSCPVCCQIVRVGCLAGL